MLDRLHQLIQSRANEIDQWFEDQWKEIKPQIYLSCDIRHSGFKVGVIDTNLFPAGFNNLCSVYSRDTSEAFKTYLEDHYPHAKKLLIYGEEHTRNRFYLSNLTSLQKLLRATGLEVRVGILGEHFSESKLSISLEPDTLDLYRIERRKNRVVCQDFIPDLILSNNDFSSGSPQILEGIDQPLIPPLSCGWHFRKKKGHFDCLKDLISQFAAHFDLDPWQLHPYTEVMTDLDWSKDSSVQELADKVDGLLKKIEKKYQEYAISDQPYVYLKNNSGTYGLGILPVFSGEEVLTLNRKKRNKLLTAKGNVSVTEFIIQEGIPTVDFYSGYPLEPVMYAVGKKVVGGFFRLHESKNQLESLNAPGMSFSCLCLHKLNEPHEARFLDCKAKESVVLLSRLLAQFASLSISMEFNSSR